MLYTALRSEPNGETMIQLRNVEPGALPALPRALRHARTTRTSAIALAALLAMAATSGPAAAQSLELQRFHPAPSARADYLTVYGGQTFLPARWEAGALFQYADDPLVANAGRVEYPVVEHQLVAHLYGAWAPTDWLRLSLEVPAVLLQGSANEPILRLADGTLQGGGLGDIRLIPQVAFYDGRSTGQAWARDPGFAIGLALPVSLPTGSGERLQSESVRAEPRLVFDYATSAGWGLGLNLGVLLREPHRFESLEIDHQLTYGAALRVPVARQVAALVVEITGAITPGADEGSSAESPLEGLAALRLFVGDGIVTAGGGAGLVDGYGAPDARLLLGFAFAPTVDPPPPEPEPVIEPPPADDDGDGLTNEHDQCPEVPEDFDFNLDEDGCPDPDNDGDGILDASDECPDQPESINEFQDDDGCPDEVPVHVGPTHIEIEGTIYFDYDSATIQARSLPIIDAVAGALAEHPELLRVQVEGHTDSQGDDDYNRTLSQRRAESVVTALVERGVDPARLSPVGFGESRLIDQRDSEEAHQTNRRVEFLILEREGEGE
jgi:outer membrane protein OmpA-like peptidoglycan-associated protein